MTAAAAMEVVAMAVVALAVVLLVAALTAEAVPAAVAAPAEVVTAVALQGSETLAVGLQAVESAAVQLEVAWMGSARQAAVGPRADLTEACLVGAVMEPEAAVAEAESVAAVVVAQRVALEELTAGACSRVDGEAALGVVRTAEEASAAGTKEAVA